MAAQSRLDSITVEDLPLSNHGRHAGERYENFGRVTKARIVHRYFVKPIGGDMIDKDHKQCKAPHHVDTSIPSTVLAQPATTASLFDLSAKVDSAEILTGGLSPVTSAISDNLDLSFSEPTFILASLDSRDTGGLVAGPITVDRRFGMRRRNRETLPPGPRCRGCTA